MHLLKNIRNNLLNLFPEFIINGNRFSIDVPGGEIIWSLLHAVRDSDEKLNANLRKASAGIKIFYETTVAAVKSYFPERTDAAQFLKLVNTWWTITNSNTR